MCQGTHERLSSRFPNFPTVANLSLSLSLSLSPGWEGRNFREETYDSLDHLRWRVTEPYTTIRRFLFLSNSSVSLDRNDREAMNLLFVSSVLGYN